MRMAAITPGARSSSSATGQSIFCPRRSASGTARQRRRGAFSIAWALATTALALGRMNKRGQGYRKPLQGPQWVGFVLWALACAVQCGCNNAKYGEVTGQVTLDGKPLQGVAVRF